jgi:hypothetical protein
LPISSRQIDESLPISSRQIEAIGRPGRPSQLAMNSTLLLWIFLATSGFASTSHAGCPSENPTNQNAGETWDEEVADALGVHRFSLPESYDAEQPMPLLLYFHGWGTSSIVIVS